MSSLTELGLISKQGLCELVSECAPFLVHPSLWIRQAVAGFISTAAKSMSVLDVQCKLVPIISKYMKYSLIQNDRYVPYLKKYQENTNVVSDPNCCWSL